LARLREAGLAPGRLHEALAPAVAGDPAAFRALVRDALDRDDLPLARAFVAYPPEPGPTTCEAAWTIRRVLQRVYDDPDPKPFLRGCLALPPAALDEDTRQHLTRQLADVLLGDGALEEADRLIDTVEDRRRRARLRLSWSRRVEDWTAMKDAAWILLDEARTSRSEAYRSWLHWQLAIAYAELGEVEPARDHAGRAAELHARRVDAPERIEDRLRARAEAPLQQD
jgi:hypothetical protein